MALSSYRADLAPDDFDREPLSWVMAEIRDAVTRSRTVLAQALTAADSTATRDALQQQARALLHQVHGALQVVAIEGATIVTQAIDDLFEGLDAGHFSLSPALVAGIDQACVALIEYLEEVLAGAIPQPMRLFPYYQDLLQARGAQRIHPADLFFPNLTVHPVPVPQPPAVTAADINHVGMRQRFEQALLPFLKQDASVDLVDAEQLHQVLGEVERSCSNQQSRAFWWVMHGFAEAVVTGQILPERNVKQLFARINLQLRRLSEGSSSIAEGLLRDALFFIARVEQPSPRLAQIRSTYQLDGMVPVDLTQKHYGRIDPAVLATARERLTTAKTLWGRIAEGDTGTVPAFEQEMRGLAEAESGLHTPALSKLLRELNGIARAAAAADPAGRLGLEMATSLLFVENALTQIRHLPDNFGNRADAMTARLVSIVAGDEVAASTAWLDDMAREAQQRQTSVALTTELQSSLRQVEKMLEAYFAHPAEHAVLVTVDAILHQVAGALTVLDHDVAARAVTYTQQMLRGLGAGTNPGPEALQPQFEKIARNLGALGLFIETLKTQHDSGHPRFGFDDQQGVFEEYPAGRRRGQGIDATDLPAVSAAAEAPAPAERVPPTSAGMAEPVVAGTSHSGDPAVALAVPVPTVEDDLLAHQQQASQLGQLVVAQMDDTGVRAQLVHALQCVMHDAILTDHADVCAYARAALGLLEDATFGRVPEDAAILATAMANAGAPAGAADLTLAAPDTDAEISAELRDVFLAEADGVLEAVRTTLPALQQQPHETQHLTALRRAFHTLKGSGRMVGLVAFGSAAWSVEQVLTQRLAETRGSDEALDAFLALALATLGDWVRDLQHNGRTTCSPGPLIAAAQALPCPAWSGVTERAGEHDKDHPVAIIHATLPEKTAATPLASLLPAQELPATSALPAMAPPLPVAGAVPAPVQAETEFPVLHKPAVPRNDTVRQIGPVEISVALYHIYLGETQAIVRLLSHEVAQWRHEPQREVHVAAVHAAHSLAGTSATVGVRPVQEVAHALESVLQQLARRPVRLRGSEFDTLAQVIERIGSMLHVFALSDMPAAEPLYVHLLQQLHQEILGRAPAGMVTFSEAAMYPLGERDVAALLSKESADFDRAPPEGVTKASGTRAAVSDRPANAGGPGLAEADLGRLPALLWPPTAPFAAAGVASAPALAVQDDLDAELWPVFTEEAHDMLPHMGLLLRQWQQAPASSTAPQALLRMLHTMKGSARMAGAMRLGQHMHDMESRIEHLMSHQLQSAEVFENLLARHDYGLHLFESLRQEPPIAIRDAGLQGGEEPATRAGPAAQERAGQDTPERRRMPRLPPESAGRGPVPLIRVRSDTLDRLVNQAGEVSIARSRLENVVGTMRQSLAQLTGNVARLHTQLREVTLQAESQIQNQAGAQDSMPQRQFDPLEFDRFTPLQEVTRLMAESVNAIGMVEQSLLQALTHASDDLSTQARLTRDLQHDLMGIRMVQFASITERLYRVTRQVSKEVDKRVSLDIRGGTIEIERGVLEKMAGPFEHLLRNAIVHGIESRDQRLAAGKSDIAELLVEVRQEGNEVAIQFSDDGQGLDLVRIRARASQMGLLADGASVAEPALTDLIFYPGFSTAATVTELAGRGVGLDVVRSEAAALGGRVVTQSAPGLGTHFTVHLPLTLAVTQVVLLTAAGKTYAVPSVQVEQVQQLKAQALAAAYQDKTVMWQDQCVPMVSLASLLGETAASPVAQPYSPLLILKSGSGWLAIHVDAILGNREVVVKEVSAQLARLDWIAGATVLGSGDMVLILNPVGLAQRAVREPVPMPEQPVPYRTDAQDNGAQPGHASDSQIVPEAGLRAPSLVMVVDDSLTVRRVMQRLLLRAGYQVVLAKDGIEALEQLASVTPHIMLVDVEMPRMDGFDLTRSVRAGAQTRHIPIIMITSRTASKHRDYALTLGVDHYLGKPFQEDQLLAVVARLVGGNSGSI